MEQASLQSRIEQQEKKDMKTSGIVTGVVMASMLVFLLIWTAVRGTIPPPGQKQYEALGSIDYGNFTNGSQDINNFEDPAPVASNEAPAQSNPDPVEEASSPVNPPSDEVITSETENEVTAPKENKKVEETTTNTKPTQEENKKVEEKQDTEPVKTDSKTDSDADSDAKKASNHGDGDKPGNRGTDQAKVLDPDGLYAFGDGGRGGLNGRMPLDLPNPVYTVQQEAKITFEFTIAPSGKVKYVKPPITTNPGLKKAGMEAIYKWRFNEVDPSVGNQTTRVTIKFRLK